MTQSRHNDEHRIESAIERLAEASARVEAGWVPSHWVRVDGDATHPVRMGAEGVHFRQVGVFEEFAVDAHQGMELRVDLDLPDEIHGTRITGDRLELTINSFRPIDIRRNATRIFRDELPTVASGPALITVLDRIEEGHNGVLSLRVLATPVPLGGEWGRTGLTVQLTTPRLRERWRLLDLAHARLLLAREFASSGSERDAVAACADDIPDDLDSPDTDALCGMLDDALRPLHWLGAALIDYRIHCIGHSHIDLAWLWTYDDTREVIMRDMESVLELFDDYPEFRFTHSQARAYAEVEQSRPDLFARLRERVAEGRLEPATVQWVEADANLPSGESQVRQLLEGIEYSRTALGVRPTVLLAPDTFGHAGNMPQLAVQAGAEVYYHHRANPGFVDDAAPSYWQAYWWTGDDGTRILAIGTPVYLGPVTASRLARDLIALGRSNGVTEVCYFYGVGDHGGGPTRADLDEIRALDEVWGFPTVRCATVTEYAAALMATDPNLPEFVGESERVFEGCYTTHADSKRMNREAENALTTAETLAALAGHDETATLSAHWRAVLHHQFHDILGGSAVAGAFADQRIDTDAATTAAKGITLAALETLAGHASDGQFTVTNSLGHAREDLVVVPAAALGDHIGIGDADGNAITVQRTADGDLIFVAELEAFETRKFRLTNDAPDAPAVATIDQVVRPDASTVLTVRTERYDAEILESAGAVTSLVDRITGARLVGRGSVSPETPRQMRPDLGLGVLVRTHELPHPMTSWVEDYAWLEETLLEGAQIHVVENGPVRAVIRVDHRRDDFDATLRFIFLAGSTHIDVEIDVDWKAVGDPAGGVPGLAATFSTRMSAPDLWVETPFAAVRREPDGYRGPMLRWADIGSPSGGMAVANDSKHGVDALGPRLRVQLLRSAYEPDPASDAGRRDRARFRVLPHQGSWKDAGVVKMAAGLNVPMLVAIGGVDSHEDPPPRRAPRVSGSSSVIVSGLALRSGRHSMRCYESAGRATDATYTGFLANEAVEETTIVGDPVRSHRADETGTLGLRFNAFEVKTLTFDARAGR